LSQKREREPFWVEKGRLVGWGEKTGQGRLGFVYEAHNIHAWHWLFDIGQSERCRCARYPVDKCLIRLVLFYFFLTSSFLTCVVGFLGRVICGESMDQSID